MLCHCLGKSIDIASAGGLIRGTEQSLQLMRDNIDSMNKDWFRSATDMASKINLPVTLPRLCGRQRHRANTPATSEMEHLSRTIAIPYLGRFIPYHYYS